MPDILTTIALYQRSANVDGTRVIAPKSRVMMKRPVANDIGPISLLPSEILEKIFTLCTSWLYGYQKPKNCLAWSQVCRAWRHIALSSGRFWQYIDFCDARFANEFLARSKQAPLHITATSPLALVPNFSTYAHRLQSLNVAFSVGDTIQFFAYIGRYLPIMSNLSLRVIPMTSTLSLVLNLPSIRQLSLESVAIDWEECKNLTHLFLRGNHEANCPSLFELHGILGSSPKIEYIRLECYTPPGENVQLPPISLPLLRDFIISSRPSTIRSVLSMIRPGPDARLQLYISAFQDLRSLFPYSLPYHPRSKAEDTHTLSAWPSNINTVRLSRHGVYFIKNDSLPWCDDPLEFILSVSSASFTSVPVCDSLHHVFDVNSITRLELNIGVLEDIPPESLGRLFRDLQHLRSLCTAFNDISHLCYILQSFDETTKLPYVPQLAKLSFSKRSDVWWYFGDTWMDSILQTMRARRDHVAPIRTLEFYNCHELCPMMIKELQSIVEQVVVIEKQVRKHHA